MVFRESVIQCSTYSTQQSYSFIVCFFSSDEVNATFEKRWAIVESEIEAKGVYDLTPAELEHGAKLAWRNAPRCPGRIQWRNLKLFDNR